MSKKLAIHRVVGLRRVLVCRQCRGNIHFEKEKMRSKASSQGTHASDNASIFNTNTTEMYSASQYLIYVLLFTVKLPICGIGRRSLEKFCSLPYIYMIFTDILILSILSREMYCRNHTDRSGQASRGFNNISYKR